MPADAYVADCTNRSAAPSVADVCVVPQLYNARRFGVELDAYPALLRVERACAAHPAFVEAHPDNQPDAES